MLEAESREKREAWQRAAFVGWQQYCLTPKADHVQNQSFGEYLDNLGLSEPDEYSNLTDDDILENAYGLMEMLGVDMRPPQEGG